MLLVVVRWVFLIGLILSLLYLVIMRDIVFLIGEILVLCGFWNVDNI